MSDIPSKYLVPKTFAEQGLHETLPICTYMLTQHTQCHTNVCMGTYLLTPLSSLTESTGALILRKSQICVHKNN